MSKPTVIFEGQTYLNGRGDILGPMVPCFMAGWIEDQYGTHYDTATGVQYGHVKGSTGNIVRIAPASPSPAQESSRHG